ncbi:MAG: hypothetical protein JF587_13620 [Catenulisporales bacterium]|jgi:uncharacterized membrane protein|nr:hypothetical protein [Catenulisporales bacterium]
MIDAWLLFGHVIGVVVLVAGIGLEVYAVAAAGRARTVAELRLAVRPARVLPVLMPLSTLLMTGCGLALVAHDPDFRFGDAWVVAAIGIVVAVSVVGGGFSGRPATRLLDAADAAPEGPLPPHLAGLVRDPILLASARITAIAAVWGIWLMSVRPHAVGTLLSLVVALLLSSIAAAGSVTRALPSAGSDQEAAASVPGQAAQTAQSHPPDQLRQR